jgi:hypothetical protein
MLRDLGARTGEAKSAIEACKLAAEVVAGYVLDIPVRRLLTFPPERAPTSEARIL